jgi:hypothetical protein
MKIQVKDIFHGTALTQIVEHPSFKALNKADNKYGHYQINNDTRILIKHCSSENSPWTFNLNKEDINTLIGDISFNHRSYLCLVCGKISVCLLSCQDYEKLLDTSSSSSQLLTVTIKEGTSIHVKSKLHILNHAIHHTDFPDKLFFL